MNTNPFSTERLTKSLSNYPVSKGDSPGHPFRGNQYTTGTGGATATSEKGGSHSKVAGELSDRAKEVLSDAREYAKGNGIDEYAKGDYADAHRRIAEDHATAAEKAKADGLKELAKAHTEASKAHERAAKNYERQKPQKVSFYGGEGGGRFTGKAGEAWMASANARDVARSYS